MDYSGYSQLPNFSKQEADRVRRTKKALANDHSASFKKRIQGKLNDLYHARARARKAYNTKPSYGAGTLSHGAVDSQVVSAVKGKYGQAFTDLEGQIGGSAGRQAQISKYYQDYSRELASLRGQAAQQAQAAIDAQQANTKSTQQSEQSANSQLASQMQADAASRGQSVDPSLFLKANQASAARATTANSQQTQLANAKNAYDNFYGQQGLIAKGANQATIQAENKFTQTLRDKLLGLQKEAGDFATTTRGALDEAQFQRGMSIKALNLKASDIAADNARMAANANSGGVSGGSSGGSSGGGGSSSKKVDNQMLKDYRKYRDLSRVAVRRGKLKKGHAQDWIDGLIAKGVPEIIARAAASNALYGGNDYATRDRVYRDYGFKLGLSKTAKKKGR